jgi:hypothetical protein
VDDVVRGRRLVLALVAVLGCHADGGTPVGRSTVEVARPAGTYPVDAGPAPEPSPVPPDFREHMARVSERGPSHGHADRFDAIVWANDVARAAWDGAGDLPAGSMLVEEAIERTSKGDRAAGLLVMDKRGETWRFVVVDALGRVARDSQEKACAACHRDAPRDFVFRLQ